MKAPNRKEYNKLIDEWNELVNSHDTAFIPYQRISRFQKKTAHDYDNIKTQIKFFNQILEGTF